MSYDPERVLNILKKVPSKYRGPGGALAVLKDGHLVSQYVWGYADMDKRIPITPAVLFPICSITKQFASALLFDLTKNPPSTVKGDFGEEMLKALHDILPSDLVRESGMTVDNLVDMCSGIRDYWALCTVMGSRPETPYLLEEHNPDMLRRIKTLHFQPGSEYSYSNSNFNIVERLIERVTGDSFLNLLTQRILKPAQMTTATLCPRTDRLPAPIIGYEGSEKAGFFPAPNFIEWSADAGMVASLTDMIAYEHYFDAQYTNSQTSYQAQIQPRNYHNSSPSWYRYGLRNSHINDQIPSINHGGALRGFRLSRYYVPQERLSVVVLFNHMASAPEATEFIIKQILSIANSSNSAITPAPAWFGSYLDEDTQLSVRISLPSAPGKQGKIQIMYTRTAEDLKLDSPTRGKNRSLEASVVGEGNTAVVQIQRFEDNRVLKLRRLATTSMAGKPPIQGSYHCTETESTFICAGDGDSGMLYALFDGCFGRGPPHLMTHLGEDVWVFANPRAMDDTPPGDWTVVFSRSGGGEVVKATIGCWLARKLDFVRVV